MVLLNLLRMGVVSLPRFFPLLWGLIFGFTALTVGVAQLGLPVQGIIGVLLVAILATEVLASRRASAPVGHRYLFTALGIIAVAGAFSASDASRAWCDPSNPVFQGHAIWHLPNGVGIFFAHLHYRQFRALYR